MNTDRGSICKCGNISRLWIRMAYWCAVLCFTLYREHGAVQISGVPAPACTQVLRRRGILFNAGRGSSIDRAGTATNNARWLVCTREGLSKWGAAHF